MTGGLFSFAQIIVDTIKDKRDKNRAAFLDNQKRLVEQGRKNKEEMLQRVANRPLLLETIGKIVNFAHSKNEYDIRFKNYHILINL